MKIVIGPKVRAKMDRDSQDQLVKEPCSCNGDPTCESCEGAGVIYVMPVSRDDMDAIRENFARQGHKLPGSN